MVPTQITNGKSSSSTVPASSTSTKGRLIELAVKCSGRLIAHFPALRRALLLKVAPDLRIRTTVASEYLRGSGIEIGALHAPVGLAEGTRVLYVDKFPTDSLRSQYPELSEQPLVEVDIVDDGERLNKIWLFA